MATTPGSDGQLLASGLYKLLSPIVEECDARIQEVMDSQTTLSSQIETLAADLDFFMTFTQTPPLAAHLQRLLNARNRLVTINTSLLTIMNRLDKIAAGVDPNVKERERKVSIGSLFKGITSGSSPQKPSSAASSASSSLSSFAIPPPEQQSLPPQSQDQTLPPQTQDNTTSDPTPSSTEKQETEINEKNDTQKENSSEPSLP